MPETHADSSCGCTLEQAPAVCLKDVFFAYDAAPVLASVNLDIHAGEFAFVVGPNGGGKTTLLKLISGMLRPTSGSVQVFGRSPAEARTRIGYTPQHARFDPSFPVTLLDVVLMGRVERRLGGRYRGEDHEAALRALEEVDLADLCGRPFSDLSGGQRQRALIARALAGDPDLLLLDEPTANVDAAVGRRLVELLGRLNERMTIVMVSHDIAFVSKLVGTVVCVNHGVARHPTAEVTQEEILRLFGDDVRVIQHGLHLAEEPHRHA